jgi:hypothetical protein
LWFKASPGNYFQETVSQKTLHKNRIGGVAQGEGPEFKPQYHTHTKKSNTGFTRAKMDPPRSAINTNIEK